MEIKDRRPADLQPYENNPRNNEHAVDRVAESIRRYGFQVPIVIDENDIVVAGHTRLQAAKLLKLETVPTITAEDLTPEQIAAFRLADNKTGEIAEWDRQALEKEIAEIEQDLTAVGFGAFVPVSAGPAAEFSDAFSVPPFSVIDGRTGAWQTRRAEWRERLLRKHRGEDLAYDACLAETLLRWFCPEGEAVADPAGIPTIREVAAELARSYAGGPETRECGLFYGHIDLGAGLTDENARVGLCATISGLWDRADSQTGRKGRAAFVIREGAGTAARICVAQGRERGWELQNRLVFLEPTLQAERAYLGFEDRRPFQVHRMAFIFLRQA